MFQFDVIDVEPGLCSINSVNLNKTYGWKIIWTVSQYLPIYNYESNFLIAVYLYYHFNSI